ncbi:unnamed protein product [Enterobius vermicularis]|uniref:Uncharacterized protein n=1 Tax=Enterobius vermicularis TaxID=51028 RepID=A0A0N4VFH0_ENTVE|nr:unnamed protein product [Enterobius vermicularis]
MDEHGMKKICFDLEDRPPLSYWEKWNTKSIVSASVSSLPQQNIDERHQKIRPEDWIKAPEFVPRSKQLLTQSFYVEPQYAPESSSKSYFDPSYSYSNICAAVGSADTLAGSRPTVSAYQPQLDFNPFNSNSLSLISTQKPYNVQSLEEDLSVFGIGGSCPDLFDLLRNTNEQWGNLESTQTGTVKTPSSSNANNFVELQGTTGALVQQTSDHQIQKHRIAVQSRNYKAPAKACVQMATFNPEYNTTSSKIVSNKNKEGFVQDCFEGVNVRLNNFDNCEELTLSDTEEVSPPRLKQFPWFLDKTFGQYTSLNRPERVCCDIM